MIRFYTDHYFQIGSAHYSNGKPCQDYSRSGSNELIACAIVSDGCSTGGHTDVGSRILTLSTFQAIRDHAKASRGALDTAVVSITSRQQQIISTSKIVLGLEPKDMYATCVYAYLTLNGGFIHVQGDGVVALKYRNGNIKMFRYDWAKNAPFYPSYDDADAKMYINNPHLHEGDERTALLTGIETFRNFGGAYSAEQIRILPFSEGRNGAVINLSIAELTELEYCAVFTDGITQIGKLPRAEEFIDWKDAVVEFLGFKSLAGEFVKRRMIRGLKDLEKLGKGPIDDISCAVVRIDNTEEEIIT